MSDKSLLWQKFKNGDIDALGSIFNIYFRDMYFYGLKIVSMPDLVKDIIQEMFVTLWERKERLGEVRNVKSYLLIILRRELIQAQKKYGFDNVEDVVLFTISAEDIAIQSEEDRESRAQLNKAIQQLTPRQQEIIFLRFYNNIEFIDIAEILGMNVQSVRNLLFRSLKKIRESMSL